MDRVELHPNVPDVRPYMAQSALMAVPLRIGGGSRLKIIEALAARLPVVSTAVGAEGLRLMPGRDYDLADHPADMAAAITARLEQPAPVSDETWSTVASNYDWSILADRLEAVWTETAAPRLSRIA
jgi:glycosyltransferase involved in cell wall biosynthesis